MVMMNDEEIHPDHPAVKMLAALIEGKGNIPDVSPLFELLNKLKQQYNPQNSINVNRLSKSDLADELNRILPGVMSERTEDESEMNLTLAIDDNQWKKLLLDFYDIYLYEDHLRRRSKAKERPLQKYIFSAIQGMIERKYEEGLQTWAALIRGDTQRIPQSQIKPFRKFLSRLDPKNQNYDRELAEDFGGIIEMIIKKINREYRNTDPNPTFNFDDSTTPSKLFTALTRVLFNGPQNLALLAKKALQTILEIQRQQRMEEKNKMGESKGNHPQTKVQKALDEALQREGNISKPLFKGGSRDSREGPTK